MPEEHPLVALRRIKDVSRRRIARLADTSDTFISQVERGERRLPPERLRKIADALDLTPREIEALRAADED